MGSRGSIWRVPGMVALAWASLTGFSGYAALLPVAPLWVVRGGADAAGAGLVNFVLLLSTVATQFGTPALIRRIGWGHTLAAAMVLLGVPALLHAATADLVAVLALSAVRGVGFGLLTVAISAAAVLLVTPDRRGAAIGAYSLSISIPVVALMPTGVWVAETWGFWPVFLVSGLSLLGVPACYRLARHLPHRSTRDPAHPAPAPGAPLARSTLLGLVAPSAILLAITLAGGALITFAPQMVATGWLATIGLLALSITTALARWRVGALADRLGPGRLTWPFVIVGVAGLASIAWLVRTPVTPAQAVPWLLACAVLGLAYGGLQNLTMLRAFEAVGPRAVGAASAVWNAAYDAGTAIGSATVGAVAVASGFGVAMGLTAGLCLMTLPVALAARPRR